jgi:hypothetical protein
MTRSKRARVLVAPIAAMLLAGGVLVMAAAPAGAVDVSTEAQLRSEFDTGTEITLTGDIFLEDCVAGSVERSSSDPLVLDGAGFSIVQTCPLAADNGVLDVNTNAELTLRNVTITGGNTEDSGGGLDVEDGDVTVVNSTFADNFACVDGGAFHFEESTATIVASTLTGNFAGAEGGAVEGEVDDSVLVAINSTITNNQTADDTAFESDGSMTLIYSDVVENEVVGEDPACVDDDALAAETDPDDVDAQQGVAANVQADTLTSFGTVVALATPSDEVNCNFNNDPGTVSLGYNYSDDDTCEFTDPTDTEDGTDPLLGALAANGGPTLTRLPAADSPLLEQIPEADCGGPDGDITTDQRGEPRPGFALCDIGAVELQPVPPPPPPPIVLEPTFTG